MNDKLIKSVKKTFFALLLAIGAVIFSQTFYGPIRFNTNGLRKEAQKIENDLDSMMIKAKVENERNDKIYGHLDSLINCKHPLLALPIVDSLISRCSTIVDKYDLLYYKGEIYLNNNQTDSSLFYYNLGLAMDRTSNLLLGRANLYKKTGRLNAALKDDEEALTMNSDFAVEVGDVFSLLYKKDSAKYYYTSYLEHYPNDTNVTKKIKELDLIKP